MKMKKFEWPTHVENVLGIIGHHGNAKLRASTSPQLEGSSFKIQKNNPGWQGCGRERHPNSLLMGM